MFVEIVDLSLGNNLLLKASIIEGRIELADFARKSLGCLDALDIQCGQNSERNVRSSR